MAQNPFLTHLSESYARMSSDLGPTENSQDLYVAAAVFGDSMRQYLGQFDEGTHEDIVRQAFEVILAGVKGDPSVIKRQSETLQ